MEKELRIKLNTVSDLKGIESVKRSFSEMERESMRAVSAQRSVSSATSDAAKSVDNLSERIGFMGHAYVGFQAVMAGSSYMSDLTRDAIAQADTWNLLEGRLRLVTDSTQQLVSVQADLFDIAQESRTSFESNADLYARIARATQDMNKSQYETLDVTEAISKSFIVSGAAAESAKAAVIQLGQGFASGVLRGEELNSVLEQAPRLAEAIAEGMGVTVGQLKTLGEDGKLTAEKVYEAILTQKSAIEEEFNQMPKTVGQSLVVLTNQIGLTIHEFDQMHGVTVGIASAISDVTVVLSEHSGEIGDYVGYVGTAVSTIIAWKIGTVALNGAQQLHAAYIAASTVATTSYSIATNTTTASVTTLTARQVAANAAIGAWNRLIAVNPYAIAGAAIVGVGLVLKNQADELRDSVRRTAVDVENLSAKALQAKITYGTIELDKVNESINNPSIMQSLFGNERIALHRRVQIENELKTYGKQLQKLHEVANAKPSGGGVNKPYIPTEKELKSAAKAAEEYAKNYKSLQDTIFGIGASDHDKAIKAINDQSKVYRDQKLPEVEIARYVTEAKSALNRKELDELGKMMTESLKQSEENYAKADQADQERYIKQIESANALYSAINELSDNWYDNELVNISNRATEFAAAGLEDIKIVEYVNASISKIDKKRYEEQSELAKKQWEEQNAWWLSFFSDLDKAMGNQLFDAMVGKWNSFGDWLKDFWDSLTTSIARAISSRLSSSIIGSVQDMLIGTNSAPSGIQNIFSYFGGAAQVSGAGMLGVGSVLSADQIAMFGGTSDSSGFTTTAGGTVFDSAGQITTAGTDIGNLVNSASALNNAYTLATQGINGLLYAPSAYMANLAGTAYGAGFTGTGSFLAGGANVLAGGGVSGLSGAAYYGGLATAGALGGLGGYAVGSLGDKLLGANTRAANYGAIGGSIGAIAGSIIPGLGTLVGGAIGTAFGSVIGGMFGKTKTTGSGIHAWSNITSDSGMGGLFAYTDYQKKSWFKSKSWTEYYGLSSDQMKQIQGIFTTYDYLLGQLGDVDRIVVGAGRYTGTSFYNAIDRAFIRAFVDDPNLTDYFYGAWTQYASSLSKTVQETFATAVNDFIGTKRSFETWSLERIGMVTESLKKQAEWARGDLEAVADLIGAQGVTVDNYLEKYNEAIRSSFTPETINNWKSLGDALMNATNASDAYNAQLSKSTDELEAQADAIKQTMYAQVNTGFIPDMMLAKIGTPSTSFSVKSLADKMQENADNSSQMVAQLYEVIRTLKDQLKLAQFNSTSGIPA
ncbi:MAG: tape measure protein [Campylobacterota bacterium]